MLVPRRYCEVPPTGSNGLEYYMVRRIDGQRCDTPLWIATHAPAQTARSAAQRVQLTLRKRDLRLRSASGRSCSTVDTAVTGLATSQYCAL